MNRLAHGTGQAYSDDSESLQADVMRFMAIIAFCLIAILALVKHAEPPVAETAAADEPTAPVASTEVEQPAPMPVPVEEPVFARASEPVPSFQPEPVLEQAPSPKPEPTPEPESVLEPNKPEPVIAEAPPAAPEELPEGIVEPEETFATETAEPEEEGLILRFASDGDFLRLIARGDIRVYAFQERDVLTLSESYRFLDSKSPGQVYELLPPSIPSLIVDALKQARADIDGYRWGIALPGHISNQIERHLGQVTSGQLVIDRYGDVHHVAAS
jgi:hypothetical protein